MWFVTILKPMTKLAQRHAAVRKKKQRDIVDYLIYFFTFATPLFEVPQALEIYAHQSARDVSIWTWAFFCVDNLVWIIYGLRKRIVPIVITSVLYEVIEVVILAGIVAYAGN